MGQSLEEQFTKEQAKQNNDERDELRRLCREQQAEIERLKQEIKQWEGAYNALKQGELPAVLPDATT